MAGWRTGPAFYHQLAVSLFSGFDPIRPYSRKLNGAERQMFSLPKWLRAPVGPSIWSAKEGHRKCPGHQEMKANGVKSKARSSQGSS